jgi:glutaredoxin
MDNEVVVYSAPWCAYCQSLKKKLDQMNVKYIEKDVDEPGIREEMNEKTDNNQTIPVLFIRDKYWVNPNFSVLNEQFKSN